jgi:hypothetical protein
MQAATALQLGELSRQMAEQAQTFAERVGAIEVATRAAPPASATLGDTDTRASTATISTPGGRSMAREPVRVPPPLVPLGTAAPNTALPERCRVTPQLLAASAMAQPAPSNAGPLWLQTISHRPDALQLHQLKYALGMRDFCDGERVWELPEIDEECVQAEIAYLHDTRSTQRWFPSLPIALCQHAFLSCTLTIADSKLVPGQHGLFLPHGATLPALHLFYSGKVRDLPSRQAEAAWDLHIQDGLREFIVDGRVPAIGPDGTMLTNYLAESNKFIHDSRRNVHRFAEFGVVVVDMTHNTTNGPLELCTQYDGSDQAEEQHLTMRYNWDKELTRYIHRLAVILFRATFKVDSTHPSLAQGWSPNYAELLDTVERLLTSGAADLSQYRRILEQEEDATDPVQAEIVILLQVFEGHYHVRTYYSLLADRAQDVGQGETPPVSPLAMAGPTGSMIPHILLELPLVQKHVQFRVADHPRRSQHRTDRSLHRALVRGTSRVARRGVGTGHSRTR